MTYFVNRLAQPPRWFRRRHQYNYAARINWAVQNSVVTQREADEMLGFDARLFFAGVPEPRHAGEPTD